MNAIVPSSDRAVSPETMETVLGTGDLSKLSVQQRVEYYGTVCRSIGINPLTRPFRFMNFQGQTVLYATRDCTDQLRSLRKISITIVDKQLDGDLYVVTARATDGARTDEDMGAVLMGRLVGEARANAIMKAMTKAKRRVTLSICGLGFLDESEVATLPGAVTYDIDADPPANVEAKRISAYDATAPVAIPKPAPSPPPSDAAPKRTVRDLVRDRLAVATSLGDVVSIGDMPAVQRALAEAPPNVRAEITSMLAEGFGRFNDPPAEDADTESEAEPETGTAPPVDVRVPGEQWMQA